MLHALLDFFWMKESQVKLTPHNIVKKVELMFSRIARFRFKKMDFCLMSNIKECLAVEIEGDTENIWIVLSYVKNEVARF